MIKTVLPTWDSRLFRIFPAPAFLILAFLYLEDHYSSSGMQYYGHLPAHNVATHRSPASIQPPPENLLKEEISVKCRGRVSSFLLLFSFCLSFFDRTSGRWKFLGQGLNLSRSSDPSCYRDNTGSLTATAGTPLNTS